MPTNTQPTPIALIDDYGFLAKNLTLWHQLKPEFKLDCYDNCPSLNVLATYPILITIRERTIFTRERLKALPNLKHLALTGRASGQVDLHAATAQGIAVSTTKGSRTTTAELTAGFILMHAKQLLTNHQNVQLGAWQTVLGTELAGKTLGIIGLGRLGSKLADFGRVFGMQNVSWDSGRPNAYAKRHNIPRLKLLELCRRSHFISIQLRLEPETNGLLGKPELAAISDNALLINTSRAPIIDQVALLAELQTGRFHAALDVYETEPLNPSHPLRTLPNVIHSPHTGYVTREVYETFFNEVILNIHNVAAGNPYTKAK